MSNFIFKRGVNVKGFRARDATHIKELIHPNNDKISLPYSFAWGSLEVGDSSLPHILHNEELYYIIEGEAIMNIEGEKFNVEAGDSILIMREKSQHVINTGSKKLTFLCIVSPAWEEAKEEIFTNS